MLKARERMMMDHTLGWFDPNGPCPPNYAIDGWAAGNAAKSPGYQGLATVDKKVVSVPAHGFNFEMYAEGWEDYSSSDFGSGWALAYASGQLTWEIPGRVVPWGTIEVTPHLNLHGTGYVYSYLPESYKGPGARASVKVSARMAQGPAPGLAQLITQWTTPVTLWQEESPPIKTDPVIKDYGRFPIDYTAFVAGARVVGDVKPGINVYVQVSVHLSCDTLGRVSITHLHFNSALQFIEVQGVCMKTLVDFAQPVGFWFPFIPLKKPMR